MKEYINIIQLFFSEYEKFISLGISIALFVVLTLFRNKIAKSILSVIAKVFLRNKESYKKPLKESLQKPLALFFLLLGIFLLFYINFAIPILLKAFKIATILIICWAFVNYLSNNLFLLFHFGEDADSKINTTAIKFVSNILKIIVIAFAVVMVISELGYNVNGLLTGIGVGGLAISLAAQEAVADLIGGFVIVFDKPFIVGDLIQTPDLMGVVQDVTMRSTKIRTIEDSIVTVPNSKLADSAIVNLSKMEKRLISLEFGLEYSTPNELIENCQTEIKQNLIDDPNILPEPVRVNVSKLDDSSVNLAITCYSNSGDINEHLAIVSNVNLSIKKIIEDNGVSFAFPSTSVYMHK